MTKRLSVVFGLLTSVIVCSFFLTGKIIQKNYYETISVLNSQPNMKVQLLNYKRGLFNSTAELTVELGPDVTNLQVLSIQQKITHGPIIAANTANGNRIKILAAQIKTALGDSWQKKLQEYTTSPQPLTVTTLVSFSKQASTWIRISAVDQTTASKFHVAWDAVNGVIEHDLNLANYHAYFTFPKLIMSNPNWQFEIKNLALNLDANNQEPSIASSNILSTQTLSFSKGDKELVKLDDISAKLAFYTQEGNLALDMEANVVNSVIIDKSFAHDNMKLKANNINRATLGNLPRLGAMTPKHTLDFIQQLTEKSTDVTLELPKHFTEALLSYVSFEVYRSSFLGKFDNRPEQDVLQDITGKISKLVQGAVQQQLILDKGAYYALNFERQAQG